MIRRSVAPLLASALATTMAFPVPVPAQPGPTPVTVAEGFVDRKNDRATDLSGIACLRAVDGQSRCLMVDDEHIAVQFGTLHGNTLRPTGEAVGLVELDRRPANAIGSEAAAAPTAAGRCPDRGPNGIYGEFDGEGVAWSPQTSLRPSPFYYVVGSHACGRNGP